MTLCESATFSGIPQLAVLLTSVIKYQVVSHPLSFVACRFAPDMPCHGGLTTSPGGSNHFAPQAPVESSPLPSDTGALKGSRHEDQDGSEHSTGTGHSDAGSNRDEDGEGDLYITDTGFEMVDGDQPRVVPV